MACKLRESITKDAQHAFIIRVGSQHAPAQRIKVKLFTIGLEFAKQGTVLAVACSLLFGIHFLKHF